jgi:hypothetical protein
MRERNMPSATSIFFQRSLNIASHNFFGLRSNAWLHCYHTNDMPQLCGGHTVCQQHMILKAEVTRAQG